MRLETPPLRPNLTVAQALDRIREHGVGERIIYFYVVDDDHRLVGVVPTRRLLTAMPDTCIRDIMITRLITLPRDATVMDACDLFCLHKFLAFPVVDEERRLVGVVDVNLFTDEVFDLAERQQTASVFEAIGVRISRMRTDSVWSGFRNRFPWLLATVGSGLLCAGLTGLFETTLAGSLVIAFFITLVLGLGESVSIQSMTLAIQSLQGNAPTWRWFRGAVKRELTTAVLLGLGCGGLVTLIVWGWRGQLMPALVIGGGIVGAVTNACLFGFGVPTVLHALKLDPKIAAGPITLALADLSTLLCYFSLAAWCLR
jgi:magnesium transporter